MGKGHQVSGEEVEAKNDMIEGNLSVRTNWRTTVKLHIGVPIADGPKTTFSPVCYRNPMLAFIRLILMSIQPWLPKIKMVGGKGLKILGWRLAIGVGSPSVSCLSVAAGRFLTVS